MYLRHQGGNPFSLVPRARGGNPFREFCNIAESTVSDIFFRLSHSAFRHTGPQIRMHRQPRTHKEKQSLIVRRALSPASVAGGHVLEPACSDGCRSKTQTRIAMLEASAQGEGCDFSRNGAKRPGTGPSLSRKASFTLLLWGEHGELATAEVVGVRTCPKVVNHSGLAGNRTPTLLKYVQTPTV